MSGNTVTFEGCNYFRQRLILSTLSGKTLRIKKIRSKDDDPGLKDFEASFIRLIDKLTNGSNIIVNETGTSILYQPGLLVGGKIEHDCNIQRSIGYYLEGLICLAPFTKKPIEAVLKGVTNDQIDPSVDMIKLSTFPVLKRFLGTDEGLELKIVRRGAAPEGGGEVTFTCPCRQKLRPLLFTDPGKIKRIRGIAWAVRVAPVVTNRIVDSARSILNKFIPDIYIYTDHYKGGQSGKSPGFGLTLVAETTNGVFLCAETSSNPKGSEKGPSVPEDIGKEAAKLLLEEIYKGGCVDSTNQSMTALFMVLGQQNVSKVQTGSLTPYTIQFLRHIYDFFDVMFKVEPQQIPEEEELRMGGEKLLMTCVGVGYSNVSKAVS
ncbi:RNA 3'-terminal phosphate cyclase-like protein [Saccostrea echinata]|uniref:RNA 3'-terminal phosphate cyclase-like protein n=1 Tax=Saccostrea echinata TaxID=191078 RepID=UPI002A841B2F|nr:RNA 3'-terminal phosphate cyclase-like protein [Saccostrea echinata]